MRRSFLGNSCFPSVSTVQSQVYTSQPDLVSAAAYDPTVSTLPADYSYMQYPDQTDATQNYSQYAYPSEYTADSTWVTPEQREDTITTSEQSAFSEDLVQHNQ